MSRIIGNQFASLSASISLIFVVSIIVGKRTQKTGIDLRGFCSPSNNFGCVFFLKELHLLSKAISSTKIYSTESTGRDKLKRKN